MPKQTVYRVTFAVIGVLIALVVLFVVAVGASAVFQPGCESCHMVGEFKVATDSSPHGEVDCTACHGGENIETRLAFGTTQVTGMYLRLKPVDPSVASVPNSRCLECHEAVMETVVERNGLRILHESCSKGRLCIDCHSTTAHGIATQWPKTATMEKCYDCHGGSGVPSKCDTCHSARLPSDRIQSGTFSVTHGPNYLQTHGLAPMRTCVACHQETKCAKCHGAGLPHPADFVGRHAAAAKSSDAKCVGCHEVSFCTDCHVYPMPHSQEFKVGHAAVVEKDGQKSCERCHAPSDCTQCHLDHVHPITASQMASLGIEVPSDAK